VGETHVVHSQHVHQQSQHHLTRPTSDAKDETTKEQFDQKKKDLS